MLIKYFDKEKECISRDELTKIQSERLVELVKRVYNTVPTYKLKMDEIGLKPEDIKGIEDITKLPFTTKKDLRANYPFNMFSADKKDIVRLHASSGTTGKLTVVGYTKNDIENWAEMDARSLVACGASNESLVHVAYGYGLFTGGLGLHYGAERLGATTIPASSGNTVKQINLLKDFQTDVIACTPSYAIHLATEIEKLGIKKEEFNLKIGIFGAEPWTNEMRNIIEEKLNIKAYDIYGLSEIMGPGVACECVYQDGLHINEDYFYPEILDPETLEPVKKGEVGELVFTTLTKEGIPLIRYRTMDIASINYEPCKCGRTFVRLGKITGRTDDMLIIRGVNVFPSQIEAAIMGVTNSSIEPHYQIIIDRVNNLDVMEIQIEMSEGLFSDEITKIEKVRNDISDNIKTMLSVSAKITLVSPNSIPRSEGKAKRVIDNRKL